MVLLHPSICIAMIPVSPSDKTFIKHFAMVIAGLHVIAFLLLTTAYFINRTHPPPRAPDDSAVIERIRPVGAVYSGETGRAEAARAAQEQAHAAAGNGSNNYGGSTDGKVVYDNLCHACHEAGIAGAPKVGDAAAWKPRIAQGEDTLFNHAINGFQGKSGAMPAKGGNPSLSDDQVKAAVRWMTSQIK